MTRFLVWLDSTRIVHWLDRTVFAAKSIEDSCKEIRAAARLEIEQARRTIRGQRFLEHMAQARLNAIEQWERTDAGVWVECEDTQCPHQGYPHVHARHHNV